MPGRFQKNLPGIVSSRLGHPLHVQYGCMADRQRSDLAEQAKALYEESIRPLVEREHFGKVVSIDVDSGDYEIEREGEDWFESVRRLRARHPNPKPFSLRIGVGPVARIGGMRPRPKDAA
jgi:hypothetical protein